MNSNKFSPEIDNENENDLSDDDAMRDIKLAKCKERTRRTDLVTATVAVKDIIEGVEKVKRSVKVKSIVEIDM